MGIEFASGSKIRNFTLLSTWEKIEKVKNLIFRLKTLLFYQLFFHKVGKRNIIINPLIITPKFIELGSNIKINYNARLEGIAYYMAHRYSPSIVLNDYVSIEQNLHLTCANYIEIGKYTAIAANVTITDIHHPYSRIDIPIEHQKLEVSSVIIGKKCKINNNAVILPGVKIGDHSTIGANTVVLAGDYLAYSIIVGNPGRIVKRYDAEKREWRRTNAKGEFIDEI